MGVGPLLTKPLYDLYKSKSRWYVRLLYKLVAKAVTKTNYISQHDMDTLWEFIKKCHNFFFFCQ